MLMVLNFVYVLNFDTLVVYVVSSYNIAFLRYNLVNDELERTMLLVCLVSFIVMFDGWIGGLLSFGTQ